MMKRWMLVSVGAIAIGGILGFGGSALADDNPDAECTASPPSLRLTAAGAHSNRVRLSHDVDELPAGSALFSRFDVFAWDAARNALVSAPSTEPKMVRWAFDELSGGEGCASVIVSASESSFTGGAWVARAIPAVFSVRYTDHGRIRSSATISKGTDDYDVLDASTISENAQSLLIPFPQEEVGVGASWTYTTDMTIAGRKRTVPTAASLESLEARGARIRLTTTVPSWRANCSNSTSDRCEFDVSCLENVWFHPRRYSHASSGVCLYSEKWPDGSRAFTVVAERFGTPADIDGFADSQKQLLLNLQALMRGETP